MHIGKSASKLALVGCVLAGIAVLPYLTGRTYYLLIVNYTLLYGIGIIGLNLIWGYAGMLSLGHPAFGAISAYTTGLLMMRVGVNFWLALLAGLIVCGLCAFVIGLPVLRLKGHYLAIATFLLGGIGIGAANAVGRLHRWLYRAYRDS